MSPVFSQLTTRFHREKFNLAVLGNNTATIAIIMGLVLTLSFLFQTFALFSATFIGALSAFYIAKRQHQADKNMINKASLLKAKYLISYYHDCNELLYVQRNIKSNNSMLPWETVVPFHHLPALPAIAIADLLFLQEEGKEAQSLLKNILNFNLQYQTLCHALDELKSYHYLYLEKINIWESRVKSIKSIRESQNPDCRLIQKVAGEKLYNKLLFLDTLIHENNDNIKKEGQRILEQMRVLT